MRVYNVEILLETVNNDILLIFLTIESNLNARFILASF